MIEIQGLFSVSDCWCRAGHWHRDTTLHGTNPHFMAHLDVHPSFGTSDDIIANIFVYMWIAYDGVPALPRSFSYYTQALSLDQASPASEASSPSRSRRLSGCSCLEKTRRTSRATPCTSTSVLSLNRCPASGFRSSPLHSCFSPANSRQRTLK